MTTNLARRGAAGIGATVLLEGYPSKHRRGRGITSVIFADAGELFHKESLEAGGFGCGGQSLDQLKIY